MNILWFLRSGNPIYKDALDARSPNRFAGLRLVVWAIGVVLLIFVLWANWAVLDQITRAQGSVIASSKTQVIQSMDGGTIEAMHVKEGDTVEAGQVLVQFDKTRSEAGYLEARAKMVGLIVTVARLQAEVLGTPLEFSQEVQAYPKFVQAQTMLYNKRQSAIRAELQALQGMIDLVQKELTMTEPLLKSGDVSLTDVLRLQRQVVELKSQMVNRSNKYFQDAQAELSKSQEDLAGVQQNMAQRKSQVDQTELRAPVRGVVKNVRITTQGGVVRPGEEVMQIVPLEDDLVIQAKVSPAEIAFLKTGQTVTVKIDAYDYTIYGDLSGKLTYISADTLSEDLRQGEQPYYRAFVRTDGRRFSARPDEQLDIQPGMTATIEVKTGHRTVMQYLLKPVVKTLSQSLGER
jgi:membrane fusion protein, adhesin transport system